MKYKIYFSIACVLTALSIPSIQSGEKENQATVKNKLITATINKKNADDYLKMNSTKTRWVLLYKKDFTKDPRKYIKTDTSQCDMKWKNITTKGRTYQNGLYGLSITFPFWVNSHILKAKVISNIANYADSIKRTAFIEYSLDNKKFITLTKVEFEAGNGKLEGYIDLSGKKVNKIWIRLRAPGDNNARYGGSIVFQNINVILIGNTTNQ